MNRLKYSLLLGLCIMLLACDDKGQRAQPEADNAMQDISLRQLTLDWFAQAPTDNPPSPNGLNIVDDTGEDPTSFDELLATGQSGQVDTQ